jgi:Second Messenger Oligonucleotide or Dinucleotide Synthetase domain
MPTPTDDAFEEYDENLKLDPEERPAAEKVHNEVTDLLIDKGLIVTAFLQGSFRRKTMIAPLRDIDKIVVLHPDLVGLAADEVMDRIEAELRNAYTHAIFTRTRHALQIDFGAATFSFDTVPAWESDTDDDDVLIANRDTGGWDRSNTRELIRVIADRNLATGGVWIHQVRMAKQVVKYLLDGIVPGLHIESWAFIAVGDKVAHDEALAQILECGASHIGGTYTEPTGVDMISARLKPDVVATALPVLMEAARRAREARNLSLAGDHGEAIRIWHDLCGDCFPEPAAQDAATALGRAFQGGAVTSMGTVTTSQMGFQRSQPTRSWRAE